MLRAGLLTVSRTLLDMSHDLLRGQRNCDVGSWLAHNGLSPSIAKSLNVLLTLENLSIA